MVARERPKVPRERPKVRFPGIVVPVYLNDYHPVFIENRVLAALKKARVDDVWISRITYRTTSDMETTIDVLSTFVTLQRIDKKLTDKERRENWLRQST